MLIRSRTFRSPHGKFLTHSKTVNQKDAQLNWPWEGEVSPKLYDSEFKWPKISIITPSYNQGHFIEETILSVVNQNYPNLEFIIIDGGSDDNTVDVIKKYEDKIRFWSSEKDQGQSDAINKGLNISTGDILAYLNSDDIYYPGTLLKVASLFLTTQNEDLLIIGDCKYGHNLSTITEYDAPDCPTDLFAALLKDGICPQPSTFWTKSAIKEDFRFNSNLNFCMDQEFWLKLIYKGYKIRRIYEPLSFFRLHDKSKTFNLLKDRAFEQASITAFFAKFLDDNKAIQVVETSNKRLKNTLYSIRKKSFKDNRHNAPILTILTLRITLIQRLKLIYFSLNG